MRRLCKGRTFFEKPNVVKFSMLCEMYCEHNIDLIPLRLYLPVLALARVYSVIDTRNSLRRITLRIRTES